MFKNYFKTAWRNLRKSKFYYFINIAGLTIGLTVGLLILLWVQDEFSFDRFHRNAPQIIKLENMVGTGANRQLWSVTTAPIGMMAKSQIAGVRDFVRITYNGSYGPFKYKDKLFNEDYTYYTDPSFFSVFDFRLVKGNPANPFPDNQSIVISQSTAKRYFGDQDPIGKVITTRDTISFRVTGVVADIPKNSSIKADILFPMNLYAATHYAGNTDGQNINNDFAEFNFDTFILLDPGFSFSGFAKKLRDLHLGVKPDDTDIGYVWLPLSGMHLFRSDGSEGGYATVRMFLIIAILVLIIACINYINLSTARSMQRAKEVSLRKVVGAGRWQLFLQFVIETTLLFTLAIIISLALVYSLIPLFNRISGKELTFDLSDLRIWRTIALTIIGTLLISSIYPALLLSSFKPALALKGKITSGVSNVLFRRILVVVQFSFSIILIGGTIVIGRQLQYIRSKQLGYDRENVFGMRMINMGSHLEAVRNDLLRQPGVAGVTWSNMNVISYGGQSGDNAWDGKENGETMMISPMNVQKDFLSFFKMQLVAGSNFSGAPSDSMHFILNETAVRAARLKDPIGKKFRMWKTEGTIIGVVKDFHFLSMRHKIMPAVFYSQANTYGNIYIRTTGKNLPGVIAAAKKEWAKYNAGFPFDYSFLDDDFKRLYQSEERTGLLYELFAVIAIMVSCLGLLGLAAHTAQVRIREIGVRKVLGASVGGITRLMARDFVKLVAIAVIIATPVAWYAMGNWLQDFAYRVSIRWWMFALAGVIAVVIALVTVSFQSIR
ncbi:MAG TPA: ABC transporter permease, partial [Chitinophagaceae bacterium]